MATPSQQQQQQDYRHHPQQQMSGRQLLSQLLQQHQIPQELQLQSLLLCSAQ
jgi:hypothetical protein